MFDKFSEGSARLIVEAQKEAIEMGHSYVGTEHILLAILKQDSPLSESLGEMGVTYARAKNEIISMVGMGMRGYSSSPQMTPRAKRVIELAYEEAKYLGSEKIQPEHILLGIIREGEGIAVHVLRKMGVDLGTLRRIVVENSQQRDSDYDVERTSDNPSVRHLEGFGIDLTALAMKNQLDPVIGREEEIERVMQVLVRRKKNNPVLIGEPGIGKTAIVEGLAQRIVAGKFQNPSSTRRYSLSTLPLSWLVPSTGASSRRG